MRTAVTCLAAVLMVGVPHSGVADDASVLIEAERFRDYGGWVLDQQFMDEMGSPFLLAHGLGHPVRDATTTVTFSKAGTRRAWVRTRDWVAPWKAPGTPGRFQVLIGGKPLDTTFGTEGAEWHWQDGGTVVVEKGTVTLALHDLTGFEGRCDAILFAEAGSPRPPNAEPAMAAWRRSLLRQPGQLADAGEFDLVVVGGGIAGTAATLSAARLGVSVALIQDRPVLGGNNSSEVRVWLSGEKNKKPYPRVGDVVQELEQRRRAHYGPDNKADLYEDGRKEALVRAEKNASLHLGWRGNAVEMTGGRIIAVIAQNIRTGERLRFPCRWVADCTGHAVIGALAGADFEMTRKGHMGRCNLWNVKETASPVSFPRCPWALDLGDRPFPGRTGKDGARRLGVWYWESGFDRDPFLEGEYIRDWNFRAMYGAWDALKNVDKAFPNHALNWAAYIAGPRESRRILGDVVLSKEDLVASRTYPDGCVPTTWSMDLHLPDKRYEKGFEGDAFISKAHYAQFKRPYWVPYRCLYSRNVPNLFMAGRNISVTHEALGTVRVMRTTGMMGEIVGMAASLCREHETDPRGVHAKHLDELKELMRKGVGLAPKVPGLEPPPWIGSVGPNAAPGAKVSVSGNYDIEKYPPSHLTDGQMDVRDNDTRWLSDTALPHVVTFRWGETQTLAAARIISGYANGGQLSAPLEDFALQVEQGGDWVVVPQTRIRGNARFDWHARFDPVRAKAVRLVVTRAAGDISRIWELEIYKTKP